MASLSSCRRTLRSIISDLEDIRDGINRDFSGIGENYCVQSLNRIIDKYYDVLSDLNNVDTNRLADWAYDEE